jgi:hypothetical protein
MAKTKLFLEYDYEFLLIGIITNVPDYKLCWSLNRTLKIELIKEDDIELPSTQSAAIPELTLDFDEPIIDPKFSFFRFNNEDDHVDYILVANRSKSFMLIKEEQSVDFFLIIGGIYDEVDVDDLLKKLREDKTVITAFDIDPNKLKSKQNLLFD